ncbi:MAG: hypothetical protein JWO82_3893 [Akkermansiaceae bacterium]|nr:hypothetical protein [Akkermansiaceae bacterium]
MNLRLICLLAVAALLAAWAAQMVRASRPIDLPVVAAKPLSPAPPEPLRLRPDTPQPKHFPDRFDGLDSRLGEIALSLETLAIEWEGHAPETGKRDKWEKYALDQVSRLEIEEVMVLAEWMARYPSHDFSEVDHYRRALYLMWGARDPEGARASIFKRYDSLDSYREGLEGTNIPLDEVSNDFHLIQVGRSLSDPRSAWEAFQADEKDRRGKKLCDEIVTVPDIFENYAAKDPAAAWQIYLDSSREEISIRMLEGLVFGAPAGQEWSKLGQQLLESRHASDRNIDWQITMFAGRWLLEDADAALTWFTAHASPAVLDRARPGAGKDEPSGPANREILLKSFLIERGRSPFHDQRAEFEAVLAALIARGDAGDLAIVSLVLGRASAYREYHRELLRLIPGIRDTAVREEILLKLLRHLPDYCRQEKLALSFPNPLLAPARETIAGMTLTPAARTEVDAILQRVEVLEAENRLALPAR